MSDGNYTQKTHKQTYFEINNLSEIKLKNYKLFNAKICILPTYTQNVIKWAEGK